MISTTSKIYRTSRYVGAKTIELRKEGRSVVELNLGLLTHSLDANGLLELMPRNSQLAIPYGLTESTLKFES